VIVKLKKLKYPASLKELVVLGYPGLFMYGVSYACVYFAETRINSATTAVLFGSFPFFTAVISNIMIREDKLRGVAWIGMAIGFLGVVLISYDSLQTSRDLFIGSVLTLAGSLASAYGLVVHKKHHSQGSIYVAATVQMGFGGLLLAPAALIFERWSDFVLTPASIGSTLYLAIFGSVIAFLGYYWLLTHTRAVTVSLIAFITPLVAIFIGELVAHESLSIYVYLGTAMILSGIAIVTRK